MHKIKKNALKKQTNSGLGSNDKIEIFLKKIEVIKNVDEYILIKRPFFRIFIEFQYAKNRTINLLII